MLENFESITPPNDNRMSWNYNALVSLGERANVFVNAKTNKKSSKCYWRYILYTSYIVVKYMSLPLCLAHACFISTPEHVETRTEHYLIRIHLHRTSTTLQLKPLRHWVSTASFPINTVYRLEQKCMCLSNAMKGTRTCVWHRQQMCTVYTVHVEKHAQLNGTRYTLYTFVQVGMQCFHLFCNVLLHMFVLSCICKHFCQGRELILWRDKMKFAWWHSNFKIGLIVREGSTF